MPVIAWLAAVWGACAPVSLLYCVRTRFLEPNQMLVFRLFAAVWVGPLLTLVALLTAVAALLARGAGAERAAEALAWWRNDPGEQALEAVPPPPQAPATPHRQTPRPGPRRRPPG